MNRIRFGLTAIMSIGLMFFGLIAQADAQISRANQRQVSNVVRSMNVKIDNFRYGLDREYSRRSASQNDAEEIRGYLDIMRSDISAFQDKFNARRENSNDVSQILASAKTIDDFVNRRRYSSQVQADWASVRTLLGQLASYYGVSPYWNRSGSSNYPSTGNYPNNNYPNSNSSNRYPQNNSYSTGLTGTYQLDTARSENTRDIAEKAVNNIDSRKRDESRRDLEDKLESPPALAIDVRGNQITLASTRAPQITFTADGRDRDETLPDGRNLRLRTTLRGQELTVSSVGGDNDYTVTFSSIENGRSLKVTRRITTEYMNQTIFAESIYNKTDATARLDVYNNQNNYPTTGNNYPNGNTSSNNYPNGNYPPTARNGRTGQFVVPNGTILTGVLENEINTKISQNNDRFRMTVTAPNEYRGSIVEGYISGINRSGKVSGRSQMTMNFETIRLTNGNSYDFAGFLQSVTDTEGKTVQIDSEGTAKGDDQTKQTVTRGGIGAGLGAIIGAIAGGAKGAAIGAIIGGGAGAGSVYVQGKDDLELKAGSSITVQSSSSVR